jgi:hypothetical protein
MIEELERRQLAADPDAALQPTMPVGQAAASVLHMAEMPAGTNVQFLTVMATTMPYIGRG